MNLRISTANSVLIAHCEPPDLSGCGDVNIASHSGRLAGLRNERGDERAKVVLLFCQQHTPLLLLVFR